MRATRASLGDEYGRRGGSEQAYEPTMLSDGPFKGWFTWSGGSDPFESSIGPFCFRDEPDGRVRAASCPATRI